ncbi:MULTISPECIES: MerR family transcriptional regulator [Muribaculum]|jgi:DNA-binding transcriptional MerR regulator|uniref:MerR family transcriptional regulator n=1 Tax=Muribaculum caecicola TaxID=3038144 RepID=A0AC61S7L9_9BACT|nr:MULTISPECIES: MerR family transcriptional regulator [Muribaculum]THG54354.1 MerR family transcriptional regulator [Muribaculum caecicola]
MDNIEKKYYKIREVAELTGMAPSALRYWETKFSIIKPKRNDKGSRFYTPDDVEKIKMVQYLVKERGLKIEAAREQIKHNHSGISRHAQAVERLKEIRAQLVAMLNAMNSLR